MVSLAGFGIGGFASGLASGIKEGIDLAQFKQNQKLQDMQMKLFEQEQNDRKNFPGLAKTTVQDQMRGGLPTPGISQSAPPNAAPDNGAMFNPATMRDGTTRLTKIPPQDIADKFWDQHGPAVIQTYKLNGNHAGAAAATEKMQSAHVQEMTNRLGNVVAAAGVAQKTGNIAPLNSAIGGVFDEADPAVTGGLKFQTVNKNSKGGFTMTFATSGGKRVVDNFPDLESMLAYVRPYTDPRDYLGRHVALQMNGGSSGGGPMAGTGGQLPVSGQPRQPGAARPAAPGPQPPPQAGAMAPQSTPQRPAAVGGPPQPPQPTAAPPASGGAPQAAPQGAPVPVFQRGQGFVPAPNGAPQAAAVAPQAAAVAPQSPPAARGGPVTRAVAAAQPQAQPSAASPSAFQGQPITTVPAVPAKEGQQQGFQQVGRTIQGSRHGKQEQ